MADPKLKEAMSEIMAVLNKHDIAGQISLVSKTHSEFRCKLDPSWSCARMEMARQGFAVRFKATKESIPDKTLRDEFVSLTMHMILQIRDLAAQNFKAFDELVGQLSKYMEIDHKPYQGYEPHLEQ